MNILINGKGTVWIDDTRLLKKSFDKTTSDITKEGRGQHKIAKTGTELFKDSGFKVVKPDLVWPDRSYEVRW